MKKLLMLFLILLFGCSMFFASPGITVKDVNLVGLDGGGATIEFYLVVKNPNSFDMKLLGYSYDLKIMALPLAKGGSRDALTFIAGSTTEIRLPVHIAYGDLLEILKRRPDPDQIPYDLQTGFEVDTPMGIRAVPFVAKGTYAIPEKYRPALYLQQLKELFQQQ